MSHKKMIVYSAQICSDCQALKSWMDSKGIPYETRDIRQSPQHASDLKNAIGKEAVPHILVDGEWIRAYQVGKSFESDWAQELFESKGWV